MLPRVPVRLAPLPDPLRDRAFSVRQGRQVGLTPKQLRRRALAAPFVGVRTPNLPRSVAELADAYLAKMPDGEFFSHTTAALMHHMWLPMWATERMELHVSVLTGSRAPRDGGVRGHHLVDRPGLVQTRDGTRLSSAVETWCQLATVVHLDDLIVAGDGLLAVGSTLTLPDLRAALNGRGRPRHAQLAHALAFVRAGTRSPRETELRLLLGSAGLPEPEINAVIRTESGVFVAECDLVYRRARVILEYEGDYHRTDVRKWRDDIHRYERLQDLGYRVVRITADDIRLRPRETIARIRSALAHHRFPLQDLPLLAPMSGR